MKRKETNGFTLAELLIVVAIIAVLVAISIPIFNSQLEKARRAVDMSNMRNAYAVLMAGINSGEKNQGETYYYDAASGSLVDERPEGYGKSQSESAGWWKGVGITRGTPKGKALLIEMNQDSGVVNYLWGGSYAGLNITNSTDYNKLSETAKLERDKVLLDSLQNEFRNMTYGQLRDLFFDGNKLKSEFNGTTYTDGKEQKLVINSSDIGGLCITIAESTIIDGKVSTEGQYNNKIYLPEVFQNTGYNVSGNTNQNYITTTVSGNPDSNSTIGKNARIWVCLGISESELKSLSGDQLNQKASTAYTYIKGAGTVTDPSLSQKTRKNQNN
ncbi:MAG: type II secretion system protein [Erysipelotrichaceae bacterium]|nr:type II secretion system protein [Erysipelotrichaceae bacterium]